MVYFQPQSCRKVAGTTAGSVGELNRGAYSLAVTPSGLELESCNVFTGGADAEPPPVPPPGDAAFHLRYMTTPTTTAATSTRPITMPAMAPPPSDPEDEPFAPAAPGPGAGEGVTGDGDGACATGMYVGVAAPLGRGSYSQHFFARAKSGILLGAPIATVHKLSREVPKLAVEK